MDILVVSVISLMAFIIGYFSGRCLPRHRHEWSKWKHIGETKVYGEFSNTLPIGTEINYARMCQTCGRVQTRKEKL